MISIPLFALFKATFDKKGVVGGVVEIYSNIAPANRGTGNRPQDVQSRIRVVKGDAAIADAAAVSPQVLEIPIVHVKTGRIANEILTYRRCCRHPTCQQSVPEECTDIMREVGHHERRGCARESQERVEMRELRSR